MENMKNNSRENHSCAEKGVLPCQIKTLRTRNSPL